MLITILCILSALLAAGICIGSGAFAGLAWLWALPVSFVGGFLTLGLAFFLLLWISCAVVNQNVPQKKDSKYYRMLADLIADAAPAILRMRIHTQGLEKTPRQGRFLLVCNHLNDLDPVVLLRYFRKSQLAFISKRENSTMFLVGKIMHKIRCQLINRENDKEALKTIINCIQIIKNDEASIAVFPEGYTSRDHKFHDFRPGVFKIAQKANVPIVVCTLTNTYKVLGNMKRLKPTDIELHLLDVLQPESFQGMTAVDLARQIHTMMADDLGPAYAPEQNT